MSTFGIMLLSIHNIIIKNIQINKKCITICHIIRRLDKIALKLKINLKGQMHMRDTLVKQNFFGSTSLIC